MTIICWRPRRELHTNVQMRLVLRLLPGLRFWHCLKVIVNLEGKFSNVHHNFACQREGLERKWQSLRSVRCPRCRGLPRKLIW